MKHLLTILLALTCATSFAQSVDCEGITPKDYLPIICVGLPLAAMVIFMIVIMLKLGWIKQEGEG